MFVEHLLSPHLSSYEIPQASFFCCDCDVPVKLFERCINTISLLCLQGKEKFSWSWIVTQHRKSSHQTSQTQRIQSVTAVKQNTFILLHNTFPLSVCVRRSVRLLSSCRACSLCVCLCSCFFSVCSSPCSRAISSCSWRDSRRSRADSYWPDVEQVTDMHSFTVTESVFGKI